MSEDSNPPPHALFSLAPGAGLLAAGRRLQRLGFAIIATADALRELSAGGVRAVDVADFVGVDERFDFPPTLHPRMERALTEDVTDGRIDLVFDVPYPLSQGNDVGGHTLLALAVKGGRIPVMTFDDLARVAEAYETAGGVGGELRRELAAKATSNIAGHYLDVLAASGDGSRFARRYQHARPLAEGENPYQRPAALYAGGGDDPLALHRFEQRCGDPPCLTNLADFDAILETLVRLHRGAVARFGEAPQLAVAAKHGNACGLGANRDDRGAAVDRALWGHPAAVWGGEVICNFPLDAEVAGRLLKSEARRSAFGNRYWMLHVIGAPEADEAAVARLAHNRDRKLFTHPGLADPALRRGRELRPVRGGALVQPPADYVLDFERLEWHGGMGRDPRGRGRPNRDLDLLIAWAAAYTSSCGGNEVALAGGGRLLGVGGGPSTRDAVELALRRAEQGGHDPGDAVFCADAFFPFSDAPELLCRAGLAAGVVPGGGKHFADVLACFAGYGVEVGVIPEEFRGFCRH